MPTLDELLNNTGYSDTLEITEPGTGVKFSLGDLRKYRGAAEGESRAATTKRQEAERLASEAASLLAKLNETASARDAAAAAAIAAGATGDDWRKDPFYAPIVKVLDAYEASIKKQAETITTTQAQLERASAVYAYRQLRDEYNQAPESFRKQFKFEDVAQQVIAAKEIDNFGLPTLSKHIERATEPDRIKAASDAAVASARTKWEQDQAVAAAGKPGTGGAAKFRNVKTEKPPIAKIDDLNSDVVLKGMDEDPAFRDALEGRIQVQ